MVMMVQSLFCLPERFMKDEFDHSICQNTDINTFLLQDLVVKSSRVVTNLQAPHYFQDAKTYPFSAKTSLLRRFLDPL